MSAAHRSHHGSSDEHALIVCQSKLASVWRCLGTQSRFHSCHHPAYVHKIIINKQARQSHFNNNNLAFRGQSEVIGICAFDVEYEQANRKTVMQRGMERERDACPIQYLDVAINMSLCEMDTSVATHFGHLQPSFTHMLYQRCLLY